MNTYLESLKHRKVVVLDNDDNVVIGVLRVYSEDFNFTITLEDCMLNGNYILTRVPYHKITVEVKTGFEINNYIKPY